MGINDQTVTNVKLKPMNLANELAKLTQIMKKAFDDDTIRFAGKKEGGGPPGYDNGEFLKKWAPQGKAYTIFADEKIVGAIIVFPNNQGVNILGNIFIDPNYQNHGIGAKAIKIAEKKHPNQKWMLETPNWATRNHHFYEKMGYKKIKENYDDNEKITLFVFGKK
jgi:GNAT superfamily N-acetyltransferase